MLVVHQNDKLERLSNGLGLVAVANLELQDVAVFAAGEPGWHLDRDFDFS